MTRGRTKPPAAKAAPDAGHDQRWIDSETRKLIALRKDGGGWVSLTQIGKELRALPSFGRHACAHALPGVRIEPS